MTTTSYEAHELEQILSLLNDQQECLTLRSIMLELTVTRSVARDVLEEVVNRAKKAQPSATKYEVVRMIPKKRGEGGMSTAMELVVTDPTDSDDERHNQGSIFSISICNDTQNISEDMDEDDVDENGNVISSQATTDNSAGAAGAIQVVAAAHEKALAVQRDMFTTGSNGGAAQLCSTFGADGVKAIAGSSSTRSILPAPELCVEDEEGIRVIRREKRGRDVVVVGASYPSSAAGKKSKFGSNSSSAASKPSHNTAPTKKGKATTAAAFFKNANATSSKTKKKAEPKKTKKEEEKENSRNKKATSTNVDDFVGDVDEDEEFLEEEKARKARVAKEARKEARELMNDEKAKKRNTDGIESKRSKVAPKRQKRSEDSGENQMDIDYDDGDEEKKTGAMDAFTQKKEKSTPSAGSSTTSSGGVKKRRQKLVEETTVDANGYMRTETITVWEDVSDDEVEVKAKPAMTKAAAPKPKGKNSMKKSGGAKKQAGLASFFAKKK
mmetsp:Transcript_3069/g.4734  ORF Transcript_3069/g.4734 Transcript_3069/m.4734 type:complete len:497 (+) Transcript_3069:63-1553(+)|eukprot:CAMPEP_0201715424 /NCGR_PEP_ID=MMETSP0593-20130828/1619_1 /ASSEMBLY_ACC=CAM_ASM_000672 /TAXON_ID=267983 /ORGANISM="Skeletonema japonicum, Strain CCMP2506" /LENGTH=496 /DNA_ID=CAMNT_0048204925 /DNA_START=45 /DNA_END=1535 /DNA_ORIENTATION=-